MDDTVTRSMRIRFIHGDGSWELDLYDLDVDESIALQRLTGGRTWGDLCASMDLADAEAIKAFYWIARRRAGEDIAYNSPQMRFKWRDFTSQIVKDDATAEHQAQPQPEPPRSTPPNPKVHS